MCRGVSVALLFATVAPASAQSWQDATARCLGDTAEWTSKVELADLDGDGRLDLLLANGGDYASAGAPERARVFGNLGVWDGSGAACAEWSDAVLGTTPGLTRALKPGDVDGDGDLDLFVAGAWHTRSRLIRRDPAGWLDVSATALPAVDVSAGDAEFGDVDDDGDLDLVLADGGPLDPGAPGYVGGAVRLWRNDGAGNFTEVPAGVVPDDPIAWSWDLELGDVDGDWRLDLLVSCKLCVASLIARGTATGFAAYEALPGGGNNYELSPMDVDDDGDLDLATVNDGPGGRDRLLLGDGAGGFVDATATHLVGAANPPEDDNVVAWLDADDDGDPDLVVGSLSGADRLLLNDGAGRFALGVAATPDDTPGTLGLAAGDLDGDHRPDLVQGQGEVAFADRVQLATVAIAVDTHGPRITAEVGGVDGVVRARVDDRQGTGGADELREVRLELDGEASVARRWAVGLAWRRQVPVASTAPRRRVCAQDRAGNETCAAWQPVGPGVDGASGGDQTPISDGGGCCGAGSDPRAPVVLALGGLALVGRRRRRAGAR